jgi:hypothetical protein
MQTMKNSHKGQTVIETALMILLLFVLFFGIAEVARFWWVKNMINNAARVAVRIAIVDPLLDGARSNVAIGPCSWNNASGSCEGPTSGLAFQAAAAACSSLTNHDACQNGGLQAQVLLTVAADPDTGQFIPGGVITVRVQSAPIPTIVPGLASISYLLIPVNPSTGTITMTSQSTMRHE